MSIDEMLAGRELDALVAARLFGFVEDPDELGSASEVWYWVHPQVGVLRGEPFTLNERKKRYDHMWEKWKPSTDIAAAWQVVERLRERGWHIELISTTLGYDAIVKRYAGETFVQAFAAWAETAPLSLCRAALRALEDV